MSVRNTKLIMYGVEIQYPHYQAIEGKNEERYDELNIFYGDKPGKVGFLSDGMSGNYAVAGVILTRFGEDEELFSEGPTLLRNVLTCTINDNRKKEVLDKLEEILGYRPICDYYFVNHYS